MSLTYRVSISSFGLAAAALWLLLAAPGIAFAQSGFGVRAGVSASPDQFTFGGHYDTGPLFDHVSFRPNLEIGVGNDLTTVAANVEFVYWIPTRRKPWSLYAGGGPALNVFRYRAASYGFDHTDALPGFNMLVGLSHTGGLFTEVKLGLIDSPRVKFTVGYSFR